MNKIAIIGLGYVGLPLALRTADKGYITYGVDLDIVKIKKIKMKQDPIGEPYINEKLQNTNLRVTDSVSDASDSNIFIICVPTPVKNDYQPDLGPLKRAIESIANYLKKGDLLIIESTINPGVCDEVVIPHIEKLSGLAVNKDFYVSHCPERINPGDTKWNVTNIPRVLGSSGAEGLKITTKFYESIIDAPIMQMGSIKEAEACKVVENSFRDVNIAFVNELAKSFTALGINVKNVIDGAATKPFAFMAHYPSIGVGGHCIPVDPYYLIEYARDYGFEHEFLSLARSINNSMPEFTVDQLILALNEHELPLKNARIAVLGLSYKANVADDRESPSYKLIDILERLGAIINTYDPYFLDKSTSSSIDDAMNDAQAVVIASSHREFIEHNYKESDIKVLIDGKNCLNKSDYVKSSIVYRGIGV
jgi:nucleotide sugar dehydrogenase